MSLTRLTGKHKILVVSLNDDMAIGAVKAAQASNRLGDIYVGAQGGDPTAWPYLCGKQSFKHWEADTAYFPELYGARTVPLLVNLIKGKKEPKMVFTNHKVITPANIKSIYPRLRLTSRHGPRGRGAMNNSMTTLSARAVRKSFEGVEVLHGVDLDASGGSVLAVLGETAPASRR